METGKVVAASTWCFDFDREPEAVRVNAESQAPSSRRSSQAGDFRAKRVEEPHWQSQPQEGSGWLSF